MFLPTLIVHIEIINKYFQEFVPQLLKNFWHYFGKSVYCILKTKRHHHPIIQSIPILVIIAIFFIISNAIQIC